MSVERDVVEAAVEAAGRASFEAVRAGLGGVGVPTRTYDELSDRTRRIRADQIRPTVEAAYPVIAAAVRAQAEAEIQGREVASLPLDELPDWTELAEAVGAELRNHEMGCSGEYETVMHWPDGRTAGYRDRLAIISADAELPTVAEQEAWHAEQERAADVAPGITVDRVRAAARSMLGWCDDPTADPTILGSILAPLVRSVAAKPVDEVACPACGAMIRARMSDQPDGPAHEQIDRSRAEDGLPPLYADAQPAAPVAAPTEPSGHEFTFTVEMSGEGCNWSSTLVPVTVRAHNLHDALRQAVAVPFAQWFPADGPVDDDVDRLRSIWRESPQTRGFIEDRYPGLAYAIERAVMKTDHAASPEHLEHVPVHMHPEQVARCNQEESAGDDEGTWRGQSTDDVAAMLATAIVAAPTEPADWQAIAAEAVEALRLTREYVGEKTLPAWPGWSWFDATNRYRAAAGLLQLPAEPAAGQFTAGEVVCVRCGRRGTDLPEIEPPNGDLLEALERSLVQARGDGLPPDTGEEH